MCTITALAACFSLSGFYIDGSVIHRDEGRGELVQKIERVESVTKIPANLYAPAMFVPSYKNVTTYSIDRKESGPYAIGAIGYSINVGPVSVRIEASREFSDGVNAASLGVTWRPFAH